MKQASQQDYENSLLAIIKVSAKKSYLNGIFNPQGSLIWLLL
jgi:hypothetical protein